MGMRINTFSSDSPTPSLSSLSSSFQAMIEGGPSGQQYEQRLSDKGVCPLAIPVGLPQLAVPLANSAVRSWPLDDPQSKRGFRLEYGRERSASTTGALA